MAGVFPTQLPAYLYAIAIGMLGMSYLAGVILFALPQGAARDHRHLFSLRKFGHGMIADAVQGLWVLLIFSSPALVLNLLSALAFGGDLDGLYNQELYPWIGIAPGGGAVAQTGTLPLILNGMLVIVSSIILLYGVQIAAVSLFGVLAAIFGEGAGIISGFLNALGSFFSGILGIFITYWLLGYVPILMLAPAAIFVLIGVFYLAQFILQAWPVMMALGAWLFTLPLGFGRKWGAALIATSLILYVGLPLMPVFVDTLGNPASATSALELVESANPSLSPLLNAARPSGVYFTVSTLGPTFSDYFRVHFKQLSGGRVGSEWVIWTDKSGWGNYPLPAGSYEVSGVDYLGIPVQFTPANYEFSTSESNVALGFMSVPSSVAMVSLQVQVYAFSMEQVTMAIGVPPQPKIISEPFFLDMGRWSGSEVKSPPSLFGLKTFNITICPTLGSNTAQGTIFIPNPQTGIYPFYYGTTVQATLGGVPVQLQANGITSNLGAFGATGQEFTFTIPLTECKVLSLTAASLTDWNDDYPRVNVDPTGYSPPKLTSSQQQALTVSLQTNAFFFASAIFLPAVYLGVILPAVSVGLAKLILRRWGR